MAAVASKGTATVTTPSDTEILIVREFNAPKHLIYKAWTTPELIKRWWSAKRGAVTLADVDLRVGGKWRWVLEAEEGFEVGFHGEYRELVPAEKIVCTEVFEGMPDGEALNTLELSERDGRTTLRLLVTHSCQEHRDAHLNSGMESGMQDALDLLEEAVIDLA
ncbi:MAG TPA: SRPBCC family protein [Herpetosiphonaceae bacterium]